MSISSIIKDQADYQYQLDHTKPSQFRVWLNDLEARLGRSVSVLERYQVSSKYVMGQSAAFVAASGLVEPSARVSSDEYLYIGRD